MLNRRHFTMMAGAAALTTLAAPLTAPLAFAQDAAEPLPDVYLGNPEAKVEVVEYASMTCPHCASFHANTFKQLKEEYIDTGKIRFVMREFPLDPLAAAVAMLARCSGQERHYDVVDLFFERQREWATRDNPLPKIFNLARQVGFTQESFEACLTNQELLDGINAVRDRGQASGVRGTPTLFVDGERLNSGRSIQTFREIIDPKLEG